MNWEEKESSLLKFYILILININNKSNVKCLIDQYFKPSQIVI